MVLDTTPPASPALLLDAGAATTGSQTVAVSLTTSDLDAVEMKVWGDVDPSADVAVQTSELASAWITYAQSKTVHLAAGDGRKYLYARLRDDVGNPTVVFSDFIDLNTATPVVALTTPLDRGRVSLISPYHQATFGWESSLPFTDYQARLVPSVSSPHLAGIAVPTSGGSLHVSGSGTFPATTTILTTVRAADLLAASPGDGPKRIKVFVRAAGVWSA